MRTDNRLAPTLVVGLGGQGCKIVARVSELANDQQKKYLSFVAFDTDVNELRVIERDYPDVKTIQTSSRLTVGEYLHEDEHAKNNWFPNNNILNRKTPSEGAGQVRAISRLVMDTAIRSGDLEPLHDAIDDLYKLTSEESSQATRIIIVSSLAGGTGSGLILPVSMYIKNYLVTKNNLNASVIRGFFLLPEVMHSVIKTEAERSNLYCNAYATLREIDAFMQKAFGTLDKRYDKLKFEVPRPGNDSAVDVYDEAPFDFCFLFSRDNIESEKMKSKDDLLAHAANCIYAQSIGPTNSRQNSSEDNTVLERVKSHGRNNYCGAGASTLIYPYNDVRDYVALNWAKTAVSDEWLTIDHEYREVVVNAQEAKARGVNSKPPTQGSHYVTTVETKAKDDDPFCKNIILSSNVYDESGMIIQESKSSRYIRSLDEYISNEVSSSFNDLDQMRENVDVQIRELESGQGENKQAPEEAFTQTLQDLYRYKGLARERTDEKGRAIAFNLFESTRKPIISLDINKFHIFETNLLNGSGKMIHPNAVRYILYKCEELLNKKITEYESARTEILDKWSSFDNRHFKGSDDQDSNTGYEFINNNIKPAKHNLTGMIKGVFGKSDDKEARDLLLQAFNELRTTTNDFIPVNVAYLVFRQALEYVKSISSAFEVFYNTFSNDVHKIDRGIENLKNKYELDMNQPIRYVCATKECLEYMRKNSVNTVGSFELPGTLCTNVFEKVRKYAVMKSKGEVIVENEKGKKNHTSNFFQNVFEDTIMSFWKENVSENCDALLDMDIISAIEKEAEILNATYDKKAKLYAVVNTIDAAKNLAKPFIDAPKGLQPRIIDSCCYNAAIMSSDYDDRKQLITQELVDFGGVPSDLIPKNEIVFFRSIYNLKAQDFKRFSPPTSSMTLEQKAGNYFEAYYDRIHQIKPDTTETDVVTPHIHKYWHLINYLPDLNPGYQKELEDQICTAFISGMLFKKIIYRPKNKSGRDYLYEMAFKESLNENYKSFTELKVSNGTDCDRLYEVFDSLCMNPAAIAAILDDCQADIEMQEEQKIRFRDSNFVMQMKRFKLAEFNDDIHSLLELPLFYKYSCPTRDYYEGWSKQMLSSVFKLIRHNIESFENAEDVNDEYCNVIYEQFKLFMDNLPKLESLGSLFDGIAVDSLTSTIQDAAIYELKRNGDERHFAVEEMKENYYNQAIAKAKEKLKLRNI